MKTRFELLITVSVICLIGFSGWAAGATIGTSITYQGVLSDDGSAADGTFDFRFTLVDAATGGTTVAGPLTVLSQAVSDGRVSLELDFGDVFDDTALWLNVEVRDTGTGGAYTLLTPRQKLTAAPQARHAITADTAADAATLNGQSPAYYLAWSNISSRPAGLDDGDNDTLGALSCAADEIARWTGSAWTCTADDDTLAGLACGTDEIARWTGSAWNCTTDSDPLPVLSNTIYVAINGTPTGPGTMEEPFDTAQAGYDAAATAFPGVTSAVVLMGGGSFGPLFMHAGTVHVLGHARSELDELTVIFGIPSPPFPAPAISGKQRVENVIVNGPAQVANNGFGAWVKFHNCRFLDGLTIDESYVEVQDCAVQLANQGVPAMAVGMGGVPITEIGIYQSSVMSNDPTPAPGVLPGALTVGPMVMDFEVIGCQIVNEGGAAGGTAPAIQDLSPGFPPGSPLHLYSHNVIKGPPTGTGNPAVADSILPNPPPPSPTIVFTHNTVYGDVGGTGGVPLPLAAPQFYANNTIYGLITYAGAGAMVGWVQAGAGPGLDAAGNTEHPIGWALGGFTLPSHWDD